MLNLTFSVEGIVSFMKAKFIYKNYPFLLAFLLPVSLMLGYFIYRGMYPFGKSSLLTVDLGQQYVDFFVAYRDTLLHHPAKLFYSFSKAIGGEMMGEYAYYLLSPFNLFLLPFKENTITAGIMLITLLKYGCSGLSMVWLLEKRFKESHLMNITFAIAYALMGWFVANQLNLLWLDAAVFLPLIIAGFFKMLDERKPLLYILMLGWMMIINYYMAYMICLFLILFLCYYLASTWTSIKDALHKLLTFGLSSLLAGGLSCVTLLPTIFTLSTSKGQYTQQKVSFHLEYNPLKILSKLTLGSFNFTQMPSGQPNIFMSTLALFLFIIFFLNQKFSLRQKLTAFLITVFFILSMCFEPLDLLWHGMQFPVWYPSRFSFLFCFWVIYIARQSFGSFQAKDRTKLFVPFFLYALMLFYLLINMKKFNFMSNKTLFVSAVFALLSLALLACSTATISTLTRDILLFVVVCFEMSLNAYLSLNNISYLTQKEYTIPSTALRADKKALTALDKSLYRVAMLYVRTKNDGLANNLNTGSYFSSALEKTIPDFYGQIGNPDGDSYAAYTNGTLITDTLLNMKYIVQPKNSAEVPLNSKIQTISERPDTNEYQKVAQTKQTTIYQNPYATGIVYAANKSLLSALELYNDPITYQTNWLNYASGTWPSTKYFFPTNFSEVVFQNIPKSLNLTGMTFKKIKTDKEAQIIFKFTPTTNDSYYLTLGSSLDNDYVTWYLGNRQLNYYDTFRHTVVLNIANHQKGDEIILTAKLKKNSLWLSNFVLYRMDTQSVLAKLKEVHQNRIQNVHYSQTKIAGTLKTTSNQILATTIPYSKGWSLKVDGKKVPIIKIQEAFVGASVDKGKHHIELTYQPPYLVLGLIISVISLMLVATGQIIVIKRS